MIQFIKPTFVDGVFRKLKNDDITVFFPENTNFAGTLSYSIKYGFKRKRLNTFYSKPVKESDSESIQIILDKLNDENVKINLYTRFINKHYDAILDKLKTIN